MQLLREATTESSRCQLKKKKKAQPKSAELCLISNPFQYSCLENSLDRGAWWATLHGVAKSQTGLSTHAGDQQPEFLCLRMEEWKLELLLKTYSQNVFVP